MKAIAIIPARYASSRFEGKPLADIDGKSMIQRVYEQVKKCDNLSGVYVATDDERIAKHVRDFGGDVCLTSPLLPNGTSRCWQAYENCILPLGKSAELIVNVQGDEPYIAPEAITAIVDAFSEEKDILTLVKEIKDRELLFDPNVVKVVRSSSGRALYFSRQALPYRRDAEKTSWLESGKYYKHIGLYAYKTDVLKEIVSLPDSSLETAECLEQLRWLDYGYSVWTCETEYESMSVDVPEDIYKITQKRMI